MVLSKLTALDMTNWVDLALKPQHKHTKQNNKDVRTYEPVPLI